MVTNFQSEGFLGVYEICFGSELPPCRSPHPKLLWKCLFSFMIIFSLSFEDPLSLRISKDHVFFSGTT